MKKFLIAVLLVLAISTGYSQTQFREIYNQTALVDKDNKLTRKFGENIFIFNYGSEPVIKLYMYDGSVRMFDQITDRKYGTTEGGMTFHYARYEERSQHFTVTVQLFDDKQYGVRLVFSDGQTIQFIP
jgi:hypothetical protein